MLRTCLVATVLLASLGPARAESPTPGPAASRAAKRVGRLPFRAVRLMPETGQALVYDRDRRTHSLVGVGDTLGGYQVVEVDDDQLVLSRDGRELVLVIDPTAPQPPGPVATGPALLDPYGGATTVSAPSAGVTGLRDPYATTPTAAPTVTAPLDPYAAATTTTPASTAATALLDPYAAAAGPRTVLAPPDQRASLQAVAPVDPYAEPKVVTAPAGAEPVKGVPAPSSDAARAAVIRTDVMTVSRTQLQAEVASFDKLAHDLGFEKTGHGVRLRQVAPDSYAYSLGLRAGDVITAIDGAPLRGLDDAAGAYVRLGTATRMSLDLERGATKGTLRFALK